MRTRRFQLARFVALFVPLFGCAPLLIGQTAPESGAKRTGPSNSVSGPGQHNSWPTVARKLDSPRGFFEGLAAVPDGPKWGYIDEAGRYVIPPRFDEVRNFHEGLAAVKEGRNWGYVDRNGDYLISPVLMNAGDYHEDRARVQLRGKIRCYRSPRKSDPDNKDDGDDWDLLCIQPKFGYLDRNGHLAIRPGFDWAADFSEGLAAVQVKGLWGYITPTGQWVIPARFQLAGHFSAGVARVVFEGRALVIDSTGQEVRQ